MLRQGTRRKEESARNRFFKRQKPFVKGLYDKIFQISGLLCIWVDDGTHFLASEKEDMLVRRNTAQSIVLSVEHLLRSIAILFLPVLGGRLKVNLWIVYFIVVIIPIVKSSKNIYFILPFFSNLSKHYVLKWFL